MFQHPALSKLPPFGALEAEIAHQRSRPRLRPGQIESAPPSTESVWSYPRPPRVEASAREARVEHRGRRVAQSSKTLRVVETSGAPVHYFPFDSVDLSALLPSEGEPAYTLCEWKGLAIYFDVIVGQSRVSRAAWTYPRPLDDLGQGYEQLKWRYAFHPAGLEACSLDGERIEPQPGGYYGGWVSSEIRGPLKGLPGSEGW